MKVIRTKTKDGIVLLIRPLPSAVRGAKGLVHNQGRCCTRGCSNPARTRGICQRCYQIWRNIVKPSTLPKPKKNKPIRRLSLGEFNARNSNGHQKTGTTRCTLCDRPNHTEFRTCERCTRKAKRKDWYAGKRDDQCPPENW